MIAEGVHEDTLKALPTFRTPPNRHLLPWNPPRTPLGQVLPLRNQTLVNRAGQQGYAMPADLVAEVLTGDADRTRAGWFEDIPLKELPFLRGGSRWHWADSRHHWRAGTPVLVAVGWRGQGVH